MDLNSDFMAALEALERFPHQEAAGAVSTLQYTPVEPATETATDAEPATECSAEMVSPAASVPAIIVTVDKSILAGGGMVSLAANGIAASLRLPPGTPSGHRLRLPDSDQTRVIFIGV